MDSLKLLIIFFLINVNAFAGLNATDVIYGEDNRYEPYERPALHMESRAVAAMVAKRYFGIKSLLDYRINTGTHAQQYGLCVGEKFEDQPILAHCSGFLVAPDVIMTAGHCIEDQSDCDNFNWVFGYEMSETKGAPIKLEQANVYQCKSILKQSFLGGPDYAIIKLDRATDRAPLKLLDPEMSSEVGDRIYMMGYPSGLPLKITEDAQILSKSGGELVTNLDAFHVNSGSPVLDEQTGLVIGILVSGKTDYQATEEGCLVVNKLEDMEGGEKLTPINVVPRDF